MKTSKRAVIVQSILYVIVLVAFTLTACGATVTPTPLPATPTLRTPLQTINEAIPFPLSEPGPYQFGTLYGTSFVDSSRNDRKVAITVWYPARDEKPDLSGAPYPLILSSTKAANVFAYHLVSYGFVVVGIDKIDYYDPWDQNMVDQPFDILFALNQVASNPPDGLDGMIDTDHAGAMGYSFDGYNSLALSGARIDPEFYLSQCADASTVQPPLSAYQIKYWCNISENWGEFEKRAGEKIAAGTDGLWQPMTDKRIRAVMPMAAEGWWLFGEKGLAAVDRPTLMIVGTLDEYYQENVTIFEHVSTPDKTLISFVDNSHMMIFLPEPVLRMKHFATAFFGYHLQGHGEYARYFSEDFVSQRDGLAWGVYEKK